MEVTLQDFAHYLAASAGAISLDESTMYLIVEEDGDLIEKTWTGTEVSDQVFIASDVKKSTPAVYFLNQDVRRVAFLDALETLQCYQYDDEREEWAPIDRLPIIPVSSKTQLSGCFYLDDQTIIFYQDVYGELQGVPIFITGEVGPSFPLPAMAKTPLIHSSFISDKMTPHLLFIREDGIMSDLKLDLATEDWQEVGQVQSGGYQISRFMVASTDDTLPLEILALSSTGILILVNQQGQQVELGTINDNRFVAVTSRECAAEIITKGAKIIRELAGTKKK